MVHLVEDGAGLECVNLQGAPIAMGVVSRNRHPGGPGYVAGQVRNAHAALPGRLGGGDLLDHRVEQDKCAVTGASQPVPADIDDEDAKTHPDLGCSQAHAPRRRSHGVHQVRGQHPGVLVDPPDLAGRRDE